MDVSEVLTLETGALGPLRDPVMLVALRGWFDAGGAATTAVARLAPDDSSITIGEIDPDPFYDFTQERPVVEIDDGELRTIHWPTNRFTVRRHESARDVVVLLGTEPHMGWATYTRCITTVAESLGCQAVVTVGAGAEAIPHTRTPHVTGSTTDAGLARRLGLSAPSYQGITGVAGVLQAALEAAGTPAVSLRVGIPHYLMNAEHPSAVAALATHLAHVLGLDVDGLDDLGPEIARWRSLHDEATEADDRLTMYVRMLEHEFDRRAEAAIPSADDLGRQFEEYLRDRRDRGDDDAS